MMRSFGIRVPLPAQLFLSYALVLAIAAVPAFVYARATLVDDVTAEATRQLRETAHRSAGVLAGLGVSERLERVRALAMMMGDRVTLLSPSGDVLFDSDVVDVSRVENHADRPEVQAAVSRRDGVASRMSATTHRDTQYVAVPLTNAKDDVTGVLRVAREVSSVATGANHMVVVFRNSLALAVTVAVVLSLLAAVRFMRPLQRITRAANAFADGDLAASSGVSGSSEVGDLGVALDTLSVELRRRLASAGSGDAVLSQLIDAVEVPCVILEVTGEVLSLNGAARNAFRVQGPNASRRLKELTDTAEFKRALKDAEGDSEPEPIDVAVAPGVSVHAHVHVLKRPGVAPLYALLGAMRTDPQTTTLPPFDGVRVCSLSDVVDSALALAGTVLHSTGVAVQVRDRPIAMVADVGERLPRALAAVLEGCARTAQGRVTSVIVGVVVTATRVELQADVACDDAGVTRAQRLVEPLGGAARNDGQGAALWLPRA